MPRIQGPATADLFIGAERPGWEFLGRSEPCKWRRARGGAKCWKPSKRRLVMFSGKMPVHRAGLSLSGGNERYDDVRRDV